MPKSNYYQIPGLDLWDIKRDAWLYSGSNPVITHAPCPQWSRMKGFSKYNYDEKELAFHCLKYVIRNGGIFEHPQGSSFFKEAGVTKNIYSVDQSWWGFPARKRTWLFYSKIKPLSTPISFDPPSHIIGSLKLGGSKKVRPTTHMPDLKASERSRMPLSFCQYLVDCVNHSFTPKGEDNGKAD